MKKLGFFGCFFKPQMSADKHRLTLMDFYLCSSALLGG